MVLTLILALPKTATAPGEAAPVTWGEWKRIVYNTPDREVDATQTGPATAPPPAPPPALQTSSEPSPPKEPVARAQIPRLWFSGKSQTGRSRRRRRRRAR